MPPSNPAQALDTRRTARKSSRYMREAGDDFLAEALAQAYEDLDYAESNVERLEDALRQAEAECVQVVEERHTMLERVAALEHQLSLLRGDPAEGQPIADTAPPAQHVPPPAPVASQQPIPVPQPVAQPSEPVPVRNVRRMTLRNTLDKVAEWMWDDPPDERDERIARSLRSRWRAGFVVAGLVALLAVTGLAIGFGIPSVQNNLESKTASIDVAAHYSSRPLLEQDR